MNVFHNFYSIFFYHSQQIIVTSSYYYRIYIDLIMIIMMKSSRSLSSLITTTRTTETQAEYLYFFVDKKFVKSNFLYKILFIQTFSENFCHYRKLFHIFIRRCQYIFCGKINRKKSICYKNRIKIIKLMSQGNEIKLSPFLFTFSMMLMSFSPLLQ